MIGGCRWHARADVGHTVVDWRGVGYRRNPAFVLRRGELCAGESSVPVVFACCMLTGCSRMRGLCRWRHVSACSTRPRCSCVSWYSVRSVFAHLFLVRAFVTATWSELTCFAQAVKPWSQTRCLWRCLLGCWLCAMASLSLVALVLSFQAIRLCVPLLVRLTAEVGSKRSCALRGMQGRGRGLGLVAGGLSAYRPWGRASFLDPSKVWVSYPASLVGM